MSDVPDQEQPRMRVVPDGPFDQTPLEELPPPGVEHLTDSGNAQRLARLHGDDLRFVHLWNRWLCWSGQCWAFDETGEVMRRAKDTVQTIYAEASANPKADVRRRIAEHARQSESRHRLEAMIRLAESEPGIPARPEEFDAHEWLFNVANGTIDLRTGELREHRREDLITKLAPVEYDPDASSPIWNAFLERVVPDQDVRQFLQRAAGYSLTGSTREQCLFVVWGGGANGKTTYLEAKRSAFGDYALHTPADTVLARRDTGIPNDVARLRSARFVTAVETEENRRLAEAQVKQLTGGDTVAARFMRGEWFEFQPVAKFWLGTNHKPGIRGTDSAIWRRIRLVPFTVTIPEDERDTSLPRKLEQELPGILAWAVRGCLEWQRGGLRPPKEVLVATQAYREEQDVLGTFLEERCIIEPDTHAPASELYAAYREWAESAGERPLSQRAFGDRLSERGFARERRGRSNRWHRLGVGLAESVTP